MGVSQLEETFLEPKSSFFVLNNSFDGLTDAVKQGIMEKVERKEFEVKCPVRDAKQVALKKVRSYAKKNGYTNIIYEENSVINGETNRHEECFFRVVFYR